MSNVILHFNSKKRTSGFPTLCKFTLPQAITRFKSFEVLGVEIPYTFYNFPRGNITIGDAINPVNNDVYSPLGLINGFFPEQLYSSSLYLKFVLDGRSYVANVAGYSTSMYFGTIADIAPRIVGDHSRINACTISIVGYKINIAITTSSPTSKVELRVDGTTEKLARLIGLDYDVSDTAYQPSYSFNLKMPGAYRIFSIDRISLYIYTFECSSVPYIGPQGPLLPIGIRYVALSNNNDNLGVLQFNDNFQVTNQLNIRIDGYPYIALKVDHSRHILAQKIGLTDGRIYNYGDIVKFSSKFTPPKVYDYLPLDFEIVTTGYDIVSTTIGPDIGPGNYDISDIITAVNAAFAADSLFSGSTLTLNEYGYCVFNMVWATTARQCNIYGQSLYGYVNWIDLLGFTWRQLATTVSNRMISVTGSNMTSATIKADRPFKPKSSFIRLACPTLGQIMSTTYTAEDDPTFAVPNVIHRIQINAGPGGTITDNQKYKTKNLVGHFDPFSSIEFGLYDEDGQVVDLNGRDWSCTIKLNLD